MRSVNSTFSQQSAVQINIYTAVAIHTVALNTHKSTSKLIISHYISLQLQTVAVHNGYLQQSCHFLKKPKVEVRIICLWYEIIFGFLQTYSRVASWQLKGKSVGNYLLNELPFTTISLGILLSWEHSDPVSSNSRKYFPKSPERKPV